MSYKLSRGLVQVACNVILCLLFPFVKIFYPVLDGYHILTRPLSSRTELSLDLTLLKMSYASTILTNKLTGLFCYHFYHSRVYWTVGVCFQDVHIVALISQQRRETLRLGHVSHKHFFTHDFPICTPKECVARLRTVPSWQWCDLYSGRFSSASNNSNYRNQCS